VLGARGALRPCTHPCLERAGATACWGCSGAMPVPKGTGSAATSLTRSACFWKGPRLGLLVPAAPRPRPLPPPPSVLLCLPGSRSPRRRKICCSSTSMNTDQIADHRAARLASANYYQILAHRGLTVLPRRVTRDVLKFVVVCRVSTARRTTLSKGFKFNPLP